MADALRNWQMFCPRRFDMTTGNKQEQGVTLLGVASQQVFPQVHGFMQRLNVVSMVDEDNPDAATHTLGSDGYYCTRCLSRAADNGQVYYYTGDQEENAAVQAKMQELQSTAQVGN